MKESTSKVIHILGSALMIGTILLIITTVSSKLFSSFRPMDFFKTEQVYKNNNSYKSNKNKPLSTSNAKKNDSANYCNLDQSEALKYLAKQSFSVNGKSVSFSTRYDYQRQRYIPNEFIINGHGSRILGSWKMYSGTSISLSNVKQVSGNFDPTNNRPLNGFLSLQCNGNLTGSIGNGSKQIQFNIIKNN